MNTLITQRTRPKEGRSFDGFTLDGHGDEDDVSCRPDILEDTHNHSLGLGEILSRKGTPLPVRIKASLGTTYSRHIDTSEHIFLAAQHIKSKTTIH